MGSSTKYIRLFPSETQGTQNGIYQIIRHYGDNEMGANVFPGALPPNKEYDKKVREYYFIVDDTGLLTYETQKYQTQLKVKFEALLELNARGEKVFYDRGDDTTINRNLATAADFNRYNNVIESNLWATVRGAAAKFRLNPAATSVNPPTLTYEKDGNKYMLHAETETTTITINGVNYTYKSEIGREHYFSSLVPRYSLTNDSMTNDAGWGEEMYPGYERLGDLSKSSDINYNLLIMDGARAFVYQQTASNSGEMIPENEPTSANYGMLRLLLNTQAGSRGDFLLNGQPGGMPTKSAPQKTGPVEGSTIIYSNNELGTRPV
jgi:hypothetical protein